MTSDDDDNDFDAVIKGQISDGTCGVAMTCQGSARRTKVAASSDNTPPSPQPPPSPQSQSPLRRLRSGERIALCIAPMIALARAASYSDTTTYRQQ